MPTKSINDDIAKAGEFAAFRELLIRADCPLPGVLVGAMKHIFINLPRRDDAAFLVAVMTAILQGNKEFAQAGWAFLEDALRAMPEFPHCNHAEIDRVVSGLALRAAGERWRPVRGVEEGGAVPQVAAKYAAEAAEKTYIAEAHEDDAAEYLKIAEARPEWDRLTAEESAEVCASLAKDAQDTALLRAADAASAAARAIAIVAAKDTRYDPDHEIAFAAEEKSYLSEVCRQRDTLLRLLN